MGVLFHPRHPQGRQACLHFLNFRFKNKVAPKPLNPEFPYFTPIMSGITKRGDSTKLTYLFKTYDYEMTSEKLKHFLDNVDIVWGKGYGAIGMFQGKSFKTVT